MITIEQKEAILNDVARQMGEIVRKLSAIEGGNKNIKEAKENIFLASDWLSDELNDMIEIVRKKGEAELEKFFNAILPQYYHNKPFS
jgi:hypothetical protein